MRTKTKFVAAAVFMVALVPALMFAVESDRYTIGYAVGWETFWTADRLLPEPWELTGERKEFEIERVGRLRYAVRIPVAQISPERKLVNERWARFVWCVEEMQQFSLQSIEVDGEEPLPTAYSNWVARGDRTLLPFWWSG